MRGERSANPGQLHAGNPALAGSRGHSYAGGLGYFCYDNGVLTVYQLATGERLYQQRLGPGSSGFSSSPVAAGNQIYITNEDGPSFVLAPGRAYKLLAENDLGETVMATPAISDGVLYIRGGKHLFAIGVRP